MKKNLIILSVLFGVASLPHFFNPETYLPVMPPFLPFPVFLVVITGVGELAFAVGIWFERLRTFAGWCMVVLLSSFLVLHGYHAWLVANGQNVPGLEFLPAWAFWVRIVLQFGLMYWVYRVTVKG
jgi:uncharacterized membrane protein